MDLGHFIYPFMNCEILVRHSKKEKKKKSKEELEEITAPMGFDGIITGQNGTTGH